MLIPRTEVPPCGWNSYDCYAGCINEEEANANLDVFLDRLKPYGFEYFCLDAAWYADGSVLLNNQLRANGMYRHMNMDEWGRYVSSPVMFPNGLKALADRCHVNGVKFGVHMMRGIPMEAVRYNTPIKGTPYHARDIYVPEDNCAWCNYWGAIDVSKPGAQEFYDSEVEYLANDIGVDFIKLDDVTEHPEDVEAFARAIQKIERPILFSLSAGGDMHSKAFARYASVANMVRITNDRWDNDEEIRQALERSFDMEEVSGPDCWMDLDMVPFGGLQVNMPASKDAAIAYLGSGRQSKLTPAGKQAMMSLIAIACSPIIYGGDLPTTPQEDFDILLNAEVLKCNRNGVPGVRTSWQNHADVRKAPSRKNDGTGWIAIFNTNWVDRHVYLTPQLLGFDKMPQLCDVWGGNRPVVQNPDGTVDFYLQKYGCAFLTYRQ
ncbi:MAG: glycoside hydrolase family 27 protein [Victivallales bacterium]|nr:glycoside hydrolase family 27 protein [Victivallales bacterium]